MSKHKYLFISDSDKKKQQHKFLTPHTAAGIRTHDFLSDTVTAAPRQQGFQLYVRRK
jgi:hypothetical protein